MIPTPYHPLIEEYFHSGKQFIYDVPDLTPVRLGNVELGNDNWIPEVLEFRIKGLDFGKDVAMLECVTACEVDGMFEWVSLNRLLEILQAQK